jgi:hypothetical protein
MKKVPYNPIYWKKHYAQLKKEVVAHYGKTCKICGGEEHLALHHTKFNGNEHRKKLGDRFTGGDWYVKLRKLGFPKDKKYPMIVLCNKCHSKLHAEHKRKVAKLSSKLY